MIFSKSFNFKGKWQTMELTEQEVEELRIKHKKNLINLLSDCKELVYDHGFPIGFTKALFDKLALQFYSVIMAELDQKIHDLNHKDDKDTQKLKDEKIVFDEQIGEKYETNHTA